MMSSGFTNASASKYLVVAVVASSILASVTDTKHLFWFAIRPHLIDYRQFWRFLTWQLCYTNSTEVLFSALTLYQLRVIERLWGWRKFTSFLLVVVTYTTFLPPLLVALIIRPLTWGYVNYIPAGPTAIVFALLAQYHAAIPYEYKYRISASDTTRNSAIELTSKSTSYLLPMQLALSQLPGSAIVAAVGWLVGYAYRLDFLPGAANWRIPDRSAGRKERERYDGLRRRMEGEAATASGSGISGATGEGAGRRRTIGGQILDQFRGTV
ncbi:hypothetical protein AAFC00_007162 [Neodothiora populina]|uniref:Peptidase S54 rhomboid domain-containing protein n=1 Tax=Neodothiora populina TaxID=2781224 RepID=A0ABR3PHL2_9PEZI